MSPPKCAEKMHGLGCHLLAGHLGDHQAGSMSWCTDVHIGHAKSMPSSEWTLESVMAAMTTEYGLIELCLEIGRIADRKDVAIVDGGRIVRLNSESTICFVPKEVAAQTVEDARRAEALKLVGVVREPIPMRLHCPACHQLHVDEGEQLTKLHRTHACQHCGALWAPAVVATVGVRFLPGCKNDSEDE